MFGRINRKLKESKSRLKSKAAAENINKWKQPISESDSDGMKAMKETYQKRIKLGLDPDSIGLEGKKGSSLRKFQDELYAKKQAKDTADELLKKDIAKMAPKAEKKVAAKGSSLAAGAFSQLERDLPKGGKAAMKVAAEQIPSAAEKALVGGMKKKAIGKTLGKAALGGALGLGAGVLLDMATDSEDAGDARADKTMAERAKYGDVAKGLQTNLPAKLKGSPKMIDMEESPSYLPAPKGKSPKDVARGFLQETKRQFPDYEEDVDVEVRNPRGETTERYGAKLKSNKPLNSVSRRKAVGIHQVLKDEPGMKSPKKGVIEFDDEE